ncbi:exo-alpha-sialidase [Fibrisoma montanum]|uniref:Exo-alpha-sialidase n=1 Tax=Fibrisoma montanum TaxID=2305895 RepID=A0A418MDU1_9BACT|nr:sialidase family protein [Fibrisoma montanum]RIV24964.1 exo-alpha-sialidase [Fibrisoma montanum]
MNIVFIIPLLLALLVDKPVGETRVSNPKFTGATPRLTTDAAGNPLLSWVEKESDNAASFYFARSSDGGRTFGEKVHVKAPANISVHAEGMPKLAVKADGTILALFEVSKPTADSPRASDLLYVTSADGGKTWTQPKPVHRDTTPGKGHSFSDLTRLPNGEIGLVWLDEKLSNQEGRSVKFVQTKPGGGFTPEVVVDENACQCCRTNVFADTDGRIHLTYRDLLPNGDRDISHVVSTDGGRTFSRPQVVFADHWTVNACPHTGPVVAQAGHELFATWFSGKEDAIGLRLARFGSPRLEAIILSSRAKHPQVVAVGDRLVWLWDESVRKPGQAEDEAMPVYSQKIALRTRPAGSTTYLTTDAVNASYPVALATSQGLLIAYEQRKGEENAVIVCRFVDSL